MAAQATDGIRLSSLNPKFLHTNSTSHTWPFSAVAELIDNAYDPDVNSKQIWIDKTVMKSNICLTFTDSGNGMTMDKLHKMLSFGFSDKVAVHGHVPVGLYGNGFKSGSMRLGKDAIVFTKNESGMHVGMLSQSYLEKINAEHVLVPIISFDQHKQLVQTPDSEANLQAITTYSLLNSETELLAELDAITGRKGTRIIIWNLRRDKRGSPEFDFDYDKYDILIPAETDGTKRGYKKQERVDQVAPDSDYSLRAYCSILYLKPRMQIVLRGQKVQTQLVCKSLALIEKDVYRPQFLQPKTIKITFGYNCRNKEHYGVMMYHKNRLIKGYEKVGCQLKANNMGVGVVGVVECNFLKPTHNKQDFDYTNEYRLTLSALGFKLNDYWNEMKVKKNSHPLNLPVEDIQKKPDQLWVQCDSCLRWRKLPDALGKLPEKWYCSMNTDPQFRDCSVPEEPEDDDDITHSTYEKTYKRRKSEQLQQMTPDKSTILFTPQNKEMQPSLSSGQRFFKPNQSQGTDLNTSCKRPLSNESASAKKQKLSGSDTIDLLQWSDDDDDEGDVIIIEDNSTAKPKNDNMKSNHFTNSNPISTEKMNSRPENLNGSDPLPNPDAIARGETSAVATQTERAALNVKKEEESNDYGCNNQQTAESTLYINCNGIAHHEMDTSHQTHHQESSVDAIDREKESLRICSEELLLRVKGLEGEIKELRSNQVKKEVSHQETQTDIGPLNPTEFPSKQLVTQYEQALKEISRLKAECEVLQNMKAEPGSKAAKSAEAGSDMDDMALQLDSLFRQLDACSTERDQYKSEAEKLKQQSAQLESQTKQLETRIEQLKHMVQDMAKKESASTSAATASDPNLTLRSLRINVAQLLTTLMPDLQLQDINYDVDVIDEILTQVLEQAENQVNGHK